MAARVTYITEGTTDVKLGYFSSLTIAFVVCAQLTCDANATLPGRADCVRGTMVRLALVKEVGAALHRG